MTSGKTGGKEPQAMSTKPQTAPSNTASSIPAMGLFGRRCAAPVAFTEPAPKPGTAGRALFGKHSAEAA